MHLDFTTITQDRQKELEKCTQDLFLEVYGGSSDKAWSMETVCVEVGKFCNTAEELSLCSMISGITLQKFNAF